MPAMSDDAMPSRIAFHLPTIGEEEIAEVAETLRSGWLTTGPRVRRFEEAFAAYVGARHAIAVNSCTAALHLALEAIGLQAGDEVIIPTYTFTATGEVVTYFGARPVLADCRSDTLNIDATTVEPLITSRTKAIIPVHVAGQACDMDPIRDLARVHGIRVIEDAAHALPTRYRGRMVGTLSDLTAFSFYATKAITTGEGGMVTTESDRYAARVRQMSLHGLSGDAWGRYADKGKWYYEVVDFGFKYNMTDVAAAMGIHQLRRSDEIWKRRRQIAGQYSDAFRGMEACVAPVEAAYGTHAWHLYVLRIDPRPLVHGRDTVIQRLGERGIGTSVHFIPLHLHPAYRRACGYRLGMFPVAEAAFDQAISLPIYSRMTDADVALVIDAIAETLREARR